MPTTRRVHAAVAAVAVTLGGFVAGTGPANAAPRGPVEIFASPSGVGSGCTLAAPCSLSSAIAKERAAELRMSSDIVVYLHGGRYPVSRTITLTDKDSGRNGHRVIFRNYPDESPALTGGQLLTGWTRGSDGLWRADANGLNFFQLYGDGVRFTRARTAAVTGHRWMTEGSSARKVEIPESIVPGCRLADLTGVQVRIMHTWRELRYPVTSVAAGATAGTCFVGLQEPISTWKDGYAITGYGPNPVAGATKRTGPAGETYLAGAREFLDQNDEWYLDTASDTVYLKTASDPNTLHVTAPVTEQLLGIDGASHITVYGLQFAHSSWNGPLLHGNIQRQGGVHMTDTPSAVTADGHPMWYPNPAAVRVGDSTDIRFQRNGFRDTGGNAVDLDAGTDDISFIGNIFTQISDTGLFVGTEQEPFAFDEPAEQNVNTVVQNNYFSWMGQTYATDSAITMSYPHGATIAHNTIENVHNIGINIGYFNGFPRDAATVLQDVHVTDNRIDHPCITARDCGGWHSVGNYVHSDTVPRSTVSGNYVTDVHANPIGTGGADRALYVDGSSNGLAITHNEWADVDQGMKINQHAGDDLIVEDNGTGDPTVIENAGLESEYRFLTGIDLGTDSVGGSRGPYGWLRLDAPSRLAPGSTVTETAVFHNRAGSALTHFRLALDVPEGFAVWPADGIEAAVVRPGQTVTATFRVTVPATAPAEYQVTARAGYRLLGAEAHATDAVWVHTLAPSQAAGG